MAENPMTETEFQRLRRFIKPYSSLNVFVYKLTGGRLMGRFQGHPICLVTMKGARSGQWRTIPLMYVPYSPPDSPPDSPPRDPADPRSTSHDSEADGEGVIIVASQGGAPKSPVWYRNLIAHPDIEVQIGARKKKLRARRADDEEKARVWPTCVEHYPPFADYQKRTDRNIPVFVCEPRA